MGISEGKSIGEWFGPNTVMQVFRLVVNMTCFYSRDLWLVNAASLSNLLQFVVYFA